MNKALAMYDLTIPFFKSGTPEELFCFLENVEKVIVGQHIHVTNQQYSLMWQLLQGDALASSNQSMITYGIKDYLNFVTCTNKLIAHVLLQQAYLEQKHYMRHFLKKPRDCLAQEFVTRLLEMNQYLDQFPNFNANQKLSTDELLDIARFVIPISWQNTICLQAFDPLAHNKDEFIEFCQ